VSKTLVATGLEPWIIRERASERIDLVRRNRQARARLNPMATRFRLGVNRIETPTRGCVDSVDTFATDVPLQQKRTFAGECGAFLHGRAVGGGASNHGGSGSLGAVEATFFDSGSWGGTGAFLLLLAGPSEEQKSRRLKSINVLCRLNRIRYAACIEFGSWMRRQTFAIGPSSTPLEHGPDVKAIVDPGAPGRRWTSRDQSTTPTLPFVLRHRVDRVRAPQERTLWLRRWV